MSALVVEQSVIELLEEALGLAYDGVLCRVQFYRSGTGIRMCCPHHEQWKPPLIAEPAELGYLLAAVIKHCDFPTAVK